MIMSHDWPPSRARRMMVPGPVIGETPEGAVALFRLARGPNGARTCESPERVSQALRGSDVFVRLFSQATINRIHLVGFIILIHTCSGSVPTTSWGSAQASYYMCCAPLADWTSLRSRALL